jgi:hypothetical protein
MWSLRRDPGHGERPSGQDAGGESWAPTLAVLYLIYAPAIAVMAIVTSVNQGLTSTVYVVCAAAIAACIPVYLLLVACRVRERSAAAGDCGATPFTGDSGTPPAQPPAPGWTRNCD